MSNSIRSDHEILVYLHVCLEESQLVCILIVAICCQAVLEPVPNDPVVVVILWLLVRPNQGNDILHSCQVGLARPEL